MKLLHSVLWSKPNRKIPQNMVNGQKILVARKHLNLGVRGVGVKPGKIVWYGGYPPWTGVPLSLQGVRFISPSE